MIEKEPKKKTALALLFFYLIVGFEVIYMISPFGLYYYSVYGKGLGFLNEQPATAWLCAFFLPHIAETSSPLLNGLQRTGWILAVLGFVLFCGAAIPVYYHKLAKKGPVTGGLYKYIRHPQYLSLIIWSFGLLLVWPRYFVLIAFVTVIFVYYFLAKAEERECRAKFGKPFEDYVNRTGRFLPFDSRILKKRPGLPESGLLRFAAIAGIYLAVFLVSSLTARGLQLWSVRTLYASYTEDSVFISLAKMDPATMNRATSVALSHPEVSGQMEMAKRDSMARFIVYIMPSQWFFSDLPMDMQGHQGHHQPKDFDRDRYKVLVMKAIVNGTPSLRGEELLLSIRDRQPLVEATIDLRQGKGVAIGDPPDTVRWGGIPTPLY